MEKEGDKTNLELLGKNKYTTVLEKLRLRDGTPGSKYLRENPYKNKTNKVSV